LKLPPPGRPEIIAMRLCELVAILAKFDKLLTTFDILDKVLNLYILVMRWSVTMVVRVAREDEQNQVNALYAAWGYAGKAELKDTVILAEIEGSLEGGVALLRGMYVAPNAQRKGVGTALLGEFVKQFGERDCYCIPYEHLLDFYGRCGFEVLPSKAAPTFLAERLAQYRADGGRVLLMRRPGNVGRSTRI
jgi:GNAT superfamily N-acetyltransferase